MHSGFAKVGLAAGIAAVPSASRLCQTVPAAATTPAVQGRAPSEDRVHSGSHHLAQIFVGYSFGADTLPYIVHNLPPTVRPEIPRVSVLELAKTADLQVHLDSWLGISGDEGLPTVAAVAKLRGPPMQCARGEEEADSACPALPDGLVDKVVLPGGHHFDGNADAVAATPLRGRPA